MCVEWTDRQGLYTGACGQDASKPDSGLGGDFLLFASSRSFRAMKRRFCGITVTFPDASMSKDGDESSKSANCDVSSADYNFSLYVDLPSAGL